MITRVCSCCGEQKDISEFPPKKTGKHGTRGQCKVCFSKKDHEYYLRNKEKYYRQSLEWHRSKKGKEQGRRSNLRKYGLSLEDYTNLFNSQEGFCGICGEHQSVLKRPLVVDHCHSTGRIRGLLCSKCNSAIGLLKDSPNIIKKAYEYLK